MPSGVFQVVLVVDDDRGQIALVSSFLKKAGFRVVSADSAITALAALDVAAEASQAISLLVTDLDMPGMSGRELAARMVARDPNLKVLYVTSNPDDLFQHGKMLQPHEAFLEKPVSSELLREAVSFLLHPPR